MTRFLGKLTLVVSLFACAACSVPLNRPAHAPPSYTISPETARIYFTMPQGFPMTGEGNVVEGKKVVGFIKNKEYFSIDVPAGPHTFYLMGGRNEEALSGTFLAGKAYHIRIFVVPGPFGYREYWTALENAGEDLAARQQELAETMQMELDPTQAEDWEEEHEEDIEEFKEDLAKGDDQPVTFNERHAL